LASIDGFVSELSRNFREHVSVLGVDAEKVFVFKRDSTAAVVVSRVWFKASLKEVIPT
jgi:hypothetical protein